jgi:hypothetical protein
MSKKRSINSVFKSVNVVNIVNIFREEKPFLLAGPPKGCDS